ncbi:MAG: histidinol-phosphatase HisJ family protein [Lachnospiraceae bacterium]|nr:histidinol-phosphatase HisJ family protein [Lachnospiraceae bacterium]
MILYDCHMHSDFSSDCKALMEEQAASAAEKGLKGICFTDHMDLEYPNTKEFGMDFLFDMDEDYSRIDKVRKEYGIRIGKGIEIGLRNEQGVSERVTNGYKELLKRDDIDFVVGATHCLDMIDPYLADYWQGMSVKDSLRRYFIAILENVRNNPYIDTLAHIDYLVRYARIPGGDPDKYDGRDLYIDGENGDIIDEILRFIKENGIALEINTAGLKYGLGYAHPKDWILKRYRDMGGELITIGSDAHKPEHVAYAFKETVEKLVALGFKEYAVFEKRKPVFYKL